MIEILYRVSCDNCKKDSGMRLIPLESDVLHDLFLLGWTVIFDHSEKRSITHCPECRETILRFRTPSSAILTRGED